MLIIFEGPPDVGKTSIINMVKENYNGVKLWHRVGQMVKFDNNEERRKGFLTLNHTICNFHLISDDNILYDRMHASEYAFGTLFNRANSGLLFADFLAIQKRLLTLDSVVIYLDADTKTLVKRRKDRNKFSIDKLQSLQGSFLSCFNHTHQYDESKIYRVHADVGIEHVFDDVKRILDPKLK